MPAEKLIESETAPNNSKLTDSILFFSSKRSKLSESESFLFDFIHIADAISYGKHHNLCHGLLKILAVCKKNST